ncbi:hypothetical protein AB0D12_01230 [Streptomyces sp. NPDC048479]
MSGGRLLINRRPIDARLVHTNAEAAYHAARAGAFSGESSPASS